MPLRYFFSKSNYLIFLAFFGASSCAEKPSLKIYEIAEIKPVVTDELIGGATAEEMREIFKCNYILDFDPNGNQIWKIKVGKEELRLSFNHSEVLTRIGYPKSFEYKRSEIQDDATYYIPKDVYVIEDDIDDTKEMDIEGEGIKLGPKDLLKKGSLKK